MENNILVFAEKPSQAKAYAEAFSVKERSRSSITLNKCETFPNGAIITWGIGHLVELVTPDQYDEKYKTWDIANLPIVPKKFLYKVSDDKKTHFNAVADLMKKADEIIIGTDIDREGELIARLVIHHIGVQNKTIKRLWINSLEKDEIKRGFNSLRDGNDTFNLYLEAQARQQADWLVGMNLSPLYSLTLQKKGFNGSLSIGRVQTPTVKMIYDRQKEIENFVSKPFYELHATFEVKNGVYKGKAKVKCDSKDELNDLYNQYDLNNATNGYIQSVETKEKKKQPPRLHSLSTLQSKANKTWKYSPSDVLKIVQELYEMKLISYPRTDTQYITENEFKYLCDNVEGYQEIANVHFNSNKEAKNRYVNNEKVEEHYAIIPTKTLPENIESMSDKKQNIYMEILRTTLAMFHEDYLYDETTVVTNVNDLEFQTKGKIEKNKGWKELFSEKEKGNEKPLPDVSEKEEVKAILNTKEKWTNPPKFYTEGQLINLMKTAGKKIENEDEKEILKQIEGIGTEATRAGIIERIKNHGYIEIKKNKAYVTKKGKILCEAVDGTLLASPSMTAKWEAYLGKIGNREGSKDHFIENITKFINKMIEDVPKNTYKNLESLIKVTNEADGISVCPSCKGQIVDRKKFYGCTGYKNGCRVSFPKKLAGKNITKSIIKTLCTKGKTNKLKGFKSKKGSKFDTSLELNDKHEIKFNFD